MDLEFIESISYLTTIESIDFLVVFNQVYLSHHGVMATITIEFPIDGQIGYLIDYLEYL